MYDNTVNMDNVPKGGGVTTVKDGLAYVPASRHPYEYPLNEAYQSFLASGLHDRSQRWGRQLDVADVSAPAIWSGGDYSADWILDRIDDFYDVRHEALSRTRLIQSVSPETLADFSVQIPPMLTFRIILFTKNRLKSFARCWESVRAALPIESEVIVDVRVDLDPDMSRRDEVSYSDYLEAMELEPGPADEVHITRADRPLGLRESILSSWQPTANHEFAIFLVRPARRLRPQSELMQTIALQEDDIEVSPYFLQYAENMVRAYVYRDRADSRLVAISLYNLRYNEAREEFVQVDNNHEPFVYQQPQSWGAVFMPEPWRQFKSWLTNFPWDQDPIVPNSLTNRWPYKKVRVGCARTLPSLLTLLRSFAELEE